MSEKKVYIQNLRKYPSTFPIFVIGKAEGDGGVEVEVKQLEKELRFDIKRADPSTGILNSTGFTPVAEEDYDKLVEQNAVFRGFITSGEYVRFDDPPTEAFLTGDIVDNLQEKLDAALERISELEKAVTAGSSAEDRKKLKTLGELNEQLGKSVADITSAKELVEKDLEAANTKIADLEKALAEAKGASL